jgi:hypothetical protein
MAEINESEKPELKEQLLVLCDDFADFHACCAFFCDAVAALGAGKDEWLDEVSAEGLGIQAQGLKERSGKLKEELAAAWQIVSH